MSAAQPEIHGLCPTRFSRVKDAFAANFSNAPEGLDELGARFSVCVSGEAAVDLWAGHADLQKTQAFGADTLVPVFSTGKAAMALLIARLVERGKLAYEERVSALWPAFGQKGKDRITVGQLMSHQSGLAGLSTADGPIPWLEPAAVVERLAAAEPLWEPGTASGYHPITIGFLAGELHRLADGRSLGRALREDLAEPFGLDLWVGLPAAEHGRVAALRKPSAMPDLGPVDEIKKAAFLDRGSAPGQRESAAWREAEIPSANMHATALALARLMSVFAEKGRLDGQAMLSPPVLAEAMRERSYGPDRVLPFTLSWAAGLMRGKGPMVFGPNPDAVGHYGWGGSMAMADPQTGVSAAYAMTRQSPHLIGDPRALRLLEALYASL